MFLRAFSLPQLPYLAWIITPPLFLSRFRTYSFTCYQKNAQIHPKHQNQKIALSPAVNLDNSQHPLFRLADCSSTPSGLLLSGWCGDSDVDFADLAEDGKRLVEVLGAADS